MTTGNKWKFSTKRDKVPKIVLLPQRLHDEGAPAPVGHVEQLPVEVGVDGDGDGGAGGLGL